MYILNIKVKKYKNRYKTVFNFYNDNFNNIINNNINIQILSPNNINFKFLRQNILVIKPKISQNIILLLRLFSKIANNKDNKSDFFLKTSLLLRLLLSIIL